MVRNFFFEEAEGAGEFVGRVPPGQFDRHQALERDLDLHDVSRVRRPALKEHVAVPNIQSVRIFQCTKIFNSDIP